MLPKSWRSMVRWIQKRDETWTTLYLNHGTNRWRMTGEALKNWEKCCGNLGEALEKSRKTPEKSWRRRNLGEMFRKSWRSTEEILVKCSGNLGEALKKSWWNVLESWRSAREILKRVELLEKHWRNLGENVVETAMTIDTLPNRRIMKI